MASILYKFRSATNFETLPLPGTQARLFDVKRAIVRAKKLDRTSAQGPGLEFDLSIRKANTNEEYTDESILPVLLHVLLEYASLEASVKGKAHLG